jgi:hypothetical protein
MYKMELKTNEKIFFITMSGFFSKEEGNKYLMDLPNKLKTFNNSDYNVVIDTQELKASSQDCVDQIKKGIELIVSAPFKGRYNIISKNLITNVQANRVGKDVNFSKINVVKSYEEVLELIA